MAIEDEANNQSIQSSGVHLLCCYFHGIAWLFLLYDLFVFELDGQSDAAGNGLAAGLHGLFVTVPLFAFVFLTSLFLIFKRSQSRKYRMIGLLSGISVSVLFLSII